MDFASPPGNLRSHGDFQFWILDWFSRLREGELALAMTALYNLWPARNNARDEEMIEHPDKTAARVLALHDECQALKEVKAPKPLRARSRPLVGHGGADTIGRCWSAVRLGVCHGSRVHTGPIWTYTGLMWATALMLGGCALVRGAGGLCSPLCLVCATAYQHGACGRRTCSDVGAVCVKLMPVDVSLAYHCRLLLCGVFSFGSGCLLVECGEDGRARREIPMLLQDDGDARGRRLLLEGVV
jgi:hypothetical protein